MDKQLFQKLSYTRPMMTSARGHTNRFLIPYARTLLYKHSFFPDSIRIWNNLPQRAVDSTSLDEFRQEVLACSLRQSTTNFYPVLISPALYIHALVVTPSTSRSAMILQRILHFIGRRRRTPSTSPPIIKIVILPCMEEHNACRISRDFKLKLNYVNLLYSIVQVH